MKFSIRIITVIIIALTSWQNAMADKLPVIDLLGEKYYVYTAKKGDSLFAIARANDWDYDKLMALNPKASAPLQKGLKIYYPADSVDISSESELVQPDDTNVPLTHKIKKGETVYGIARMYGIPTETIFNLNPGSRNGIREGATLVLTSDIDKSANSTPDFYVIKRGDTLYGVAKANGTTVAEIMKKNPGISERNFKAGDTIRLPERGEGVKSSVKTVEQEQLTSFSTYQVEKKDTWETIADKTGVDKEDLINANKDAGDKPKNKSIIAVPNIETTTIEKTVIEEDPRELSETGLAEIYEDVHGLSNAVGNEGLDLVILMSDPSSRKDLEYSRGFMTALRKLKDNGYVINLTVINGTKQRSDILTELSDINPDMIFLTAEKDIPDFLSEYAEVSQTPMVNLFDVKSDLYTQNPYLLQMLTPSTYFNEAIASKLGDDFSDVTLIMVGKDDADQIASILSENWNKNKILNVSIKNLSSSLEDVSGRCVVYGLPTKKDEIIEILDVVKDAKDSNFNADITVIGRPGWVIYDDDATAEKFHACNVIIPSRFYYDNDSMEARKFEIYYKSLFDRHPAKSFPMYAVMGYDTASYFIPELIKANKDLNGLSDSTDGVQSDFSLQRPSNWSGLVNTLVYLVRFTPYNTIEKIKVK